MKTTLSESRYEKDHALLWSAWESMCQTVSQERPMLACWVRQGTPIFLTEEREMIVHFFPSRAHIVTALGVGPNRAFLEGILTDFLGDPPIKLSLQCVNPRIEAVDDRAPKNRDTEQAFNRIRIAIIQACDALEREVEAWRREND